jgi:hypothetical protein
VLIRGLRSFAWKSFQDETFNWWGGNVYGGCKDSSTSSAIDRIPRWTTNKVVSDTTHVVFFAMRADCDAIAQSDFKNGLDMANTALISQVGVATATDVGRSTTVD